ncbi:tRNA modification GTPase [Rhodovulum iodosum]|uniref:tRNA modification GTPase MnmE n=1 Tax=Rhodovulum iodosum TaxID=68291 RepID=A0ABV3XRK4_9RHOB|nr:tRNA uridine-5-carboxymethylaminomethyl(34) synthesis GTPase MnmE [Rhodovulum robiginosum]RSK30322.1 tRNA uridine-5-carboxymethylaminomethyl(34) synthesis GTPase MnmE [Rhodovulum robiginosum]
MDTIFAQATARGKAGVAVIRISGPRARAAAALLAGPLPEPRRAGLRRLRDGDTMLDEALVIWFEVGASFTGEEVVELQCHGSPATSRAILRVLSRVDGLRGAEPGEFTRRALENGCLDMAQVEGLADLLEAETEAQRRQALRVLSGALGAKAEGWRAALIRAAALMTVTIDFADEEVPADVSDEVSTLLSNVAAELAREIDGVGIAERIREGFEVAIVGPVNAGKSTLLNALAGRDAAITSEHAGTTRDVIEVRMELNGLPVTMLDTAGLRETDDAVEAIGVARARQRAQGADLRIFLLDETGSTLGIEPGPEDIVVLGKADLHAAGRLAVSGKTGAGLSELIARVTMVLEGRAEGAATATRERHRAAMKRALVSIESAGEHISMGEAAAELAAEDVQAAIRALDSLVGRVDVEAVLDEIFASFCLGK